MHNVKNECVRPACTRTTHASHGYCDIHARIYGVQDTYVPAGPTARDIDDLVANGWSLYAIGEATGLSRQGLKFIAQGQRETVRQSTQQKIAALAGQSSPITPPTWPSARRLQSLQAAGFSQQEIAGQIGYDQTTLSKIMSGGKRFVDPAVAAAVARFYDEHKSDTVRKPARAARGKPWPTPMWWNDIDDPDEQPGVNVCLSCHGPKEAGESFYCDTCAKRIPRANERARRRQQAKKQKLSGERRRAGHGRGTSRVDALR